MDKQIESSDNEIEIDESNLSGIEPLDDEADVLLTRIEEYITSKEEMNEIIFPNNDTDTEESRGDVEVDESIKLVPVLTIGDGNCLPHSLANVLPVIRDGVMKLECA